jgi:hypothetical protein
MQIGVLELAASRIQSNRVKGQNVQQDRNLPNWEHLLTDGNKERGIGIGSGHVPACSQV